MGQKVNPNSFQLPQKNNTNNYSSQHPIEYSNLLKEQKIVSTNLLAFFEKNNCIVKDCFFILNNEKAFLTIFISFLVLKKRKKKNGIINTPKMKLDVSSMVQKFFKVLAQFGYISSKRLVLQNLNKIAAKYQKNNFLQEQSIIREELAIFNREIFFESGIFLFCLMNVTKNTSYLFGKFISKFFKILHRTKKIDKFFLFLTKIIELTDQTNFSGSLIKGLKIQIKGRFNGVPRSQIHLFERGSIPLQTVSTKISYSLTHINTSYGIFGLKIWLYE
jgi:hypothetical protein